MAEDLRSGLRAVQSQQIKADQVRLAADKKRPRDVYRDVRGQCALKLLERNNAQENR
jgi:hypothetical protein